jgi:hypothetical protein
MGGRPTVVGLLAVAAAAWCAGAIAPPPAAAEFRIPGLFEFKPKAAQRKQVFRPTIPKRNPSRVTAGVSAAAVSPEIADNSEATVVVGTASAASVALALPAAERKEAAAETQTPEIETAAMEPAADEDNSSEALETAHAAPEEDESPAEIAAVAPPAIETSENAEDETPAPALGDTEPAAIETANIEVVADPEEAAEPAEAPEQAKTPPYDASVVLER